VLDLEFIVLGSGTSAGVPVIGCSCEVCTSKDPRDNRLRTAACLRFIDGSGQQRVVLIDTSPDLRAQSLRYGLDRCDAILFTHNHVDHTFGLDEVRRFNAVMQAPIDIHAERRTLDHLYRVYKHILDRDNNVQQSFVATLIPHELDVDRPIDLFGYRFTPLRLLHGKLPILGFRIDAIDTDGGIAPVQPPPLPLAWCTDVSAIPPETWGRLGNLRTLLLDMLRYRKHPTHFNLDDAIEAAHAIGAARTWFVHMTHEIRHDDLDPKLPDGMALAYDGLTLGRSS
jgi:phosphoribosyl 1,2-cyclic phosphate phosphodiesterase